MEERPKIVILLGPTAVGKTSLSIDLAEEAGGEVISADSMQVYRYLDIGTAKPLPEERRRVRHHLIDVVDPDGEFNASRFASLARGVILRITGEGKAVFVAGGTGLYLRALTGGIIEAPGPDPGLRQALREERERRGTACLYQRLLERDPTAAGRIGRNDAVRIIRALEVLERSGESIRKKQESHAFRQRAYDSVKIGLRLPRQELYDRINRRCAEMIERGLVAEVEGLLARGYDESLKPLQSLGYKHILAHIRGRLSLEEALGRMQRDTRNYAKRQLTWFKAEKDIEWYSPADGESIRARVREFLAGAPRA